VSLVPKLGLLWRMWRNAKQPGAASIFFEHVYIAWSILRVPASVPGAVAEFGCFKGVSTASLSLICAVTGRQLLVFDSFEGLPEPEKPVHAILSRTSIPYRKGEFCGTLEEVRSNVSRLGDIRSCEFVKGYFEDTLASRSAAERFVVIFEDADLPQSVRTVLKATWKKLQPGCVFFCHEARDREVVDVFFDRPWWDDTIGEAAPGFSGSGIGIMGGPDEGWSCLGFAVRAME
jgi:O-methyltransferase